MNVSLTKEQEELVNQRVASGRYASASEVIREGLRLLEARDEERSARLEGLRAQVAAGIAQANGGDLIDGETAVAEVRKRVNSRRKRRRSA